eukprot:TRINITY_DN3287_c0_g2_i1.p1 TRINITY_DN3287_c0_g2~~TRINITY_DN3287_c0_g2_i1.p1  ORF type:complete len:133 (-),score=17.08 TRINITY_DN3287_c0_g2_i1:34-432(-)
MRNGLVVASGTKLQTTGAVYGNGIYISPSATTSFSYCKMTCAPIKNKLDSDAILDTSVDTDNLGCIAICEVINKDINKATTDIWVQPNVGYVMTRFFFVYLNGMIGNAASCYTTNIPFEKELRDSIAFFQSD